MRALQFEHGVLVLNVEHDDGLDLADAVGSLPTVSLESVGQHEDLLEFRFPAAEPLEFRRPYCLSGRRGTLSPPRR